MDGLLERILIEEVKNYNLPNVIKGGSSRFIEMESPCKEKLDELFHMKSKEG